MLIAEAVIQALRAEGTERVFSLMDVYNMDLLQALEATKTTIIRGRHEHGVVLMADGYSRVSGRPGICSIGAGPALTQIGTAMMTVKRHGSPVLVIVADTPVGDRHNLKFFDVQPFAEAMGAHFVAVAHPRTAKADVQRAFRLLRSGAGPVVLSIPLDILNHNLEAQWKYEATEVPDQRIQPAPETVEYAAILLKEAKRPVILAGKGAVASGAREQIEALADRSGALLATSLQAKDYFGEHPFAIGISGNFASDAGVKLLREADCVVAFGASLNRSTTEDGSMFPKAAVIHVDRDASVIGETTAARLGIWGDAKATAEALTRYLEQEGGAQKLGYRSAETKDVIARSRAKQDGPYVEAPGLLDPRWVVNELNRLLPRERIVAADSGHFMTFVAEGMKVLEPESFVWGAGFAALGVGVPLGVGAAMGRSDRHCVLFVGDGGFLMCPQELDTAVRHRVPMTIVLMNDEAYGAEVHYMTNKRKPTYMAEFETPDLAAIATGYGAVARTVRTESELREAVRLVGQGDRPLVLDVRINRAVMHRIWQGQATPLGALK